MKEATISIRLQAEQEELANELEKEKQEQEAWTLTLNKLKEAREEQNKLHASKIATLQAVSTAPVGESNPQLEWIKRKMAEIHGTIPPPEEVTKKAEQV